MTHGTGYFGFESIVYAALAILVVATLTAFANAVMSTAVLA